MTTQSPADSYITVAQAAKQLSLHPSTIRRWIDRGILPAYRLGQRRIGVKVSDLAGVIGPLTPKAPVVGKAVPAGAIEIAPLTPEEQRQGLAALEELHELNQRDLARRGGKPHSPSWKLLDKARKERTAALMGDE